MDRYFYSRRALKKRVEEQDKRIAELERDLASETRQHGETVGSYFAARSEGFRAGIEAAVRVVEEERDGWEDDKGYGALDAVLQEIRALAPEHAPAAARCACTHEAGDSPCPVHGMDEPEPALAAAPEEEAP